MGARAGQYPVFHGHKDAYRLSSRFLGRTTNGALAAATALNRNHNLTVTRTGTGLYTLTVQNNPLVAGGVNITPLYVVEHPDVNFLAAASAPYEAVVISETVVAGVLTIALTVLTPSTGAAVDVAATDEMSVGLWCSSSPVA